MSEEINVPLIIDCWYCGTHMTLLERSENDCDCTECGAEIYLDPFLDKAIAIIAERDARIAELEAENEALNIWRDLALQFDSHRMAALWHLKRLVADSQSKSCAELFLSEPPLAAHEVVAERDKLRAELAASSAKYLALIALAPSAPLTVSAPVAKQVVIPEMSGFCDRLMDFIQHAPVSSGVCCCGDSMIRHPDPMACGHIPVDEWDNAVVQFKHEYIRLTAADQEGGQDE